MKVALGVDHRGFAIKDELIAMLEEAGHQVVDLGTDSDTSVDYPDFAAAVGRAVADGAADRGVSVCGSGGGASIAANKIPGVLLLGRSSRSRNGWSSMVSAFLPRPLMMRWGTFVVSLLTASTQARTHGNRAIAAIELSAE